jgi:hypothetical protein
MIVCTRCLPRLREIQILNHMPDSHEARYELHAIKVVYNAIAFHLS